MTNFLFANWPNVGHTFRCLAQLSICPVMTLNMLIHNNAMVHSNGKLWNLNAEKYKNMFSISRSDKVNHLPLEPKNENNPIQEFYFKRARGIWKVLGMVFYLSSRFTKPIMFCIILKSHFSYMLWHKFHEDIIMQIRKILL